MAFDGVHHLTIQQLEALIHLVNERSFSRAAKKMHLTQPSLTKHIRNIEEALGSKVVNRSSRSLSLTPEGKLLNDYARRIVKLRDEAREQVMRIRESETGDIRIAASTIPATYILPYAIGGFRKKFPDIRTTVRTADSSDVIEMVLGNDAEIGFIGKKPSGGKLSSRGPVEGQAGACRSFRAPLGEATLRPPGRNFQAAFCDPREGLGHPRDP